MRNLNRVRGKSIAGVAIMIMAVAFAAAGCGSSSSPSDNKNNADPIKLAFLWEVKGESSYAIQDMQEGAQIAVDQLNAKGGINGRKVVYKRYPASPTDASQTLTQYLKAISDGPAITLGPPGPIQQVLKNNLEKTKVPNLPTSPDILSEFGEKFGSKYRFFGGASMSTSGQAAVAYAVDDLGAKKIGLLSSPDPSDAGAVRAIKKDLEERGIKLAAERQFATDATDVTKETLAMKGMDAILLFSYENPSALAANQLAQQGINVPVIGYSQFYPALGSGLLKEGALQNIVGGTPCNLYGDNISAEAKEFVKKYKAATGAPATFQAANAHDSVLIAAQAVAKAGSNDGDAIVKVLETEKFPGGACGTHQSNSRHNMSQTIYLHGFKTGTPVLIGQHSSKTD